MGEKGKNGRRIISLLLGLQNAERDTRLRFVATREARRRISYNPKESRRPLAEKTGPDELDQSLPRGAEITLMGARGKTYQMDCEFDNVALC